MKINLANPTDPTELRERFRRTIKAHFGGLLECEAPDYKVEFVHKTAKDFVLRKTTWEEIFGHENYDSDFDPVLALLAGHIMFIKALGMKMVTGSSYPTEFGLPYIWAVDAMHYAELADSSTCRDRKSYIGLVDELDRTMIVIAEQFIPGYQEREGPRMGWSHYEPPHRFSFSWTLSTRSWALNFLTLAALGNLLNYVEQKLSDMKDSDREKIAMSLLTDIINFPRHHGCAYKGSEWTKAESVTRYTPIGCRLVSKRMMKLLIVHARLKDCRLHFWYKLLALGWFCFSASKKSLLAKIGVVDHMIIFRQDQVRWIALLKLLLREYPAEQQRWWCKISSELHQMLPTIPDDIKSETGLDSWLLPFLES